MDSLGREPQESTTKKERKPRRGDRLRLLRELQPMNPHSFCRRSAAPVVAPIGVAFIPPIED